MGLVPSSYALCKAINFFEEGHRFIETSWTTMADTQKTCRTKHFSGDIYLPVMPISCDQNNGKPIFDRSKAGFHNITNLYCPIKMKCLNMWMADILSYLATLRAKTS